MKYAFRNQYSITVYSLKKQTKGKKTLEHTLQRRFLLLCMKICFCSTQEIIV